jgi:hypothetical protein
MPFSPFLAVVARGQSPQPGSVEKGASEAARSPVGVAADTVPVQVLRMLQGSVLGASNLFLPLGARTQRGLMLSRFALERRFPRTDRRF